MRLTLEQLQEMMNNIESDRIERTVSVDKTDKFSQAVCAFANDFPNHCLPGYLLLGVKDDGTPSGLQVTDQLLQNLAALRSDGNIQPLPTMTVQKYSLPSGHEIAAVEVFPSDLPPVRYKGQVWIRVGPRRAIASESEERRLSERRGITIKHFDVRPCLESNLEELSLDRFRLNYLPNAVAIDIIKENHRDIKQQLASLRFYDLKRDCPTYAGILLFGTNPIFWIPGAYIQFVRFHGVQLTDEVAEEQQLSGDLLNVLQSLDQLLKLHNQHYPTLETQLQERSHFLYPVVALRELLMNAVMHRCYEATAPIRFYWFTDRIEIHSPGGLYGEVTPENFPTQTAYRNPTLADAMKTLGYVNKFGSGVLRSQQELAKNGHPPAEFQFQPSYFLTIIRAK